MNWGKLGWPLALLALAVGLLYVYGAEERKVGAARLEAHVADSTAKAQAESTAAHVRAEGRLAIIVRAWADSAHRADSMFHVKQAALSDMTGRLRAALAQAAAGGPAGPALAICDSVAVAVSVQATACEVRVASRDSALAAEHAARLQSDTARANAEAEAKARAAQAAAIGRQVPGWFHRAAGKLPAVGLGAALACLLLGGCHL